MMMLSAPATALRADIPLAVAMAALMLLLAVAAPASAQDDEEGLFSLPTPEVPSAPYPGESVGAPDVTIRETPTETIYEYRVKGQVYMVKVEPIVGPAYYMLDTDGDGVLDVQEQRVPDLSVPQWLLFSW